MHLTYYLGPHFSLGEEVMKADTRHAGNLSANSQRKPSSLRRETEGRLRSYAMAATSAGVGLLALAAPAQAQVIYTAANLKVSNGPLFIDVDCGQHVQFWLANRLEFSTFANIRDLEINGSTYAAVVGNSKGPIQLTKGSMIGSSRAFRPVYRNEETVADAYWIQYYYTYSGVAGPWANGKPGYLGLKFNLSDGTHYGWAEVQVTGTVKRTTPIVQASVTGYAYEATPGTPIKAGQTRGTSSGTLPDLAKGACQDFDFGGAVAKLRRKH
jgi:hypothetical protein